MDYNKDMNMSVNNLNSSNKINNGRIDIKTPNTSDLFKLYDKIDVDNCVSLRNPTLGLWDNSLLSEAYFSRENIQIIQNGLRAGIYNISNGQYIIGPQDCDTLKIIMRSIFLQYSANKPLSIPQQIQELNKMVLDYCIQQVYSEATGYMKYIDDASTLVVPIAHPIQACNTDRQLEFKKWF